MIYSKKHGEINFHKKSLLNLIIKYDYKFDDLTEESFSDLRKI